MEKRIELLGWVLVLVALAGCSTEDPAWASADLDEVAAAPSTAPVLTDRVARLDPESRATVEASRLPILLPADEALLDTAVVTSGPHFIAWGGQADGVFVSVHGTDHRWTVGREEPTEMPPADLVRGRPGLVTENEGIRIATWDEGGIAWALDVECEQVERDARCADDSYVRALAESLELHGGAL